MANPLCELIIQSYLVAARTLYPVRICHVIVEATHVHMLLVVDNPDDVPNFMRHFKTESTHMINGLLGRDKRTLWCEGYDSPIVLTPLRALAVIAYMHANPAKDNLETTIDRYPGFSTWKIFSSGEYTQLWKRVRRYQFVKLGRDRLMKQPFDLTYRSRRSGRRRWCLSEKRKERVKFISFLRLIVESSGCQQAQR